MAQTVCINPPTPQQRQSAVNQLADEMSKKPIPRSFTRFLAGAVVGNIIDGQMDPYDEGKVPIFTALGMLAGSRMGIRATGAVGSGIKTAVDAATPRRIKEWMELDRLSKDQAYFDAYGLNIEATDAATNKQAKGLLREVRNGLAEGKNSLDTLYQSSWVQSQFSQLRAISKNAPIVKEMISFLQNIPNQIKQMKADVQMQYNARKGVDAYERFMAGTGTEVGRPIFDDVLRRAGYTPSRVNERQFRAEFNEALHRILDSGLGGENYTARRGVTDLYSNKVWAESFDQRLIENPEIAEFIATTRDFYTRTTQRFETGMLKLIDDKVSELKVLLEGNMTEEHARIYKQYVPKMVDDFRASGMTWKQFSSSIDTNEYGELAAVIRALSDETVENSRFVQLFHQIRGMQTKINQQRQMDRAYVPHVEDKRRMSALKRKLIADGKVREDGPVTEANRHIPTMEEYVERRYFEVNYGNDRKLYVNDDELKDYAVKNFRSANQAREHLKNILLNKRSKSLISADQYNEATRRLDDFIVEGRIETRDAIRKTFLLESPEDLSFNAFSAENRDGFKSFSANYRADNFDVKKSSRLDYQRNLDMPYEFRQTDFYQINNSYANDVAPRLHSIERGIYDISDFQSKWVTPMQRQLGMNQNTVEAEKIANRVKGIYNTSLRVNQFTKPEDMQNFETMARISNAWRNTMAMAYQYGIGFYNLFEHAVQTPTLTSWRSYLGTMGAFTTNRRAANAMADSILDFKVIDMQLKGQGGNYAYFDEVAGMTGMERLLERGAEFSANASLTKYLGKHVGLDIEKAGLLRIAFDGFMGGNLMSTAINAHATLLEVRKLTEVYQALRNIPEGQPRVVNMHGRRYNIGEVERKLANMGIDETNRRGFMDQRTQTFLKDFMENIKAGQRLTSEEIMENRESFAYLNTILNTTTENYQATNQFFRPERAMTPGGRLLYQYSTYSYNQVLQNLQRRIRFPIQDWTAKVPEELATRTSIAKILYYYNTGNMDALRAMPGMTNELIETFPVEAYTQIFKYFGGAVGISVLGHMTVDTFRDLVANPYKDREDQWARVRRRTIVNPLAPKSEQFTFAQMINDFGGDDMFHLPQYLASTAIDTGLLGRMDAFYSTYGRQSLMDLTPITRAANDAYRDLGRITSGGVTELSNTLSDVAVRNSLRYLPIVGSSPFSELRGVTQRALLDDPRAGRVRIDGAPIIPQNIIP